MVAEVTAVDCGKQRVLATLRRHGERHERARENGESGRGVCGVKSDATVGLAHAGEITGPSEIGGWENLMERTPVQLRRAGREWA